MSTFGTRTHDAIVANYMRVNSAMIVQQEQVVPDVGGLGGELSDSERLDSFVNAIRVKVVSSCESAATEQPGNNLTESTINEKPTGGSVVEAAALIQNW